MSKIKLQIKNRWTGDLIFEYEKEDNTIRDTILQAIASRADLRSANLRSADLRSANLRSADLRSADLGGADLYGADLYGADLRSANLGSANLYGANLGGADLGSAKLRGANLYGADLRSANLGSANLEPVKNDMFIVLLHAIPEIRALKQALKDGKVDGSTYSGSCSCLSGTVCNAAPAGDVDRIMSVRDAHRPAERFFLAIKPGDTPENNQAAKIAMEWIEEFEGLLKTA